MSQDSNRSHLLPRRDFLALAAGAAGAGVALGGLNRRGAAAADPPPAGAQTPLPSAAELVPGKDPRLIVYSAKPLEIETPLELLREQRITPKQLLFVRNNQALADSNTLQPIRDDDWRIDLTGLVEYPRQISVARLRAMPQTECEMVLQCSGNGRAFFSKLAHCDGSQWRHGAMGNVKFRGVRLRDVIDALAPHIDPAARFVTAEGRDDAASPQAADFEHSIPLADALARSIVALELGGEALPAVHGGPVRLVTPGYYGTMHVKWLGRLRFEAEETFNHHQVRRYRTPYEPIEPGSKFDYGRENSEPNWRMRVKCVIFSPADRAELPAGRTTIAGVAFNDGAVAIQSVDLTTDGGRTWRRAELTVPDSRYAWYPWRIELELPPGEHEIVARATDALGRSQPLDASLQWNPAGYAFSAADRLSVRAG